MKLLRKIERALETMKLITFEEVEETTDIDKLVVEKTEKLISKEIRNRHISIGSKEHENLIEYLIKEAVSDFGSLKTDKQIGFGKRVILYLNYIKTHGKEHLKNQMFLK